MTGCALIVVLDSDGQMIRIPPASKTPPLAPPATTRLTLSVAPDVSSSPRALWLPVNGIPILPPQASMFDLAAAARDYSDDATAAALLKYKETANALVDALVHCGYSHYHLEDLLEGHCNESHCSTVSDIFQAAIHKLYE